MADVFISYAHTTSKQAQAAAAALRAAGYSVWLDDELAVHRAFAQAIEEQLTAAKAALVIWSADAARSEWVLSEANRAREDRKLVQLVIDKTRLPMPFDQVQCADLSGWTGDDEHPNWRRVTNSVAELVRGGPTSSGGSEVSVPFASPALPDKPSIAVLALSDLSPAKDRGYFCDGMVEEIATALSRFPSLFVIGGATGLSFRGEARNHRLIAAQLGVRYLLEGSVRRSGDQVRITVSLIDAVDNAPVWSNRFDGALDDVFALQDQVANAVAAQIEPQLRAVDLRRAAARPTEDLSAYELYLRARQVYLEYDPATFRNALALFEKAYARDPNYAEALAWAAEARTHAMLFRWIDDAPESSTRKVRDELRRALMAGGDNPTVLAAAGSATAGLAYMSGSGAIPAPGADTGAAETLVSRALSLNPGAARTWLFAAWSSLVAGRLELSLERYQQALRLDPRSPDRPEMAIGMGGTLARLGRYAEAVPWLEEALALRPSFSAPILPQLVIVLAQLGRAAEVHTLLARSEAMQIIADIFDASRPFPEEYRVRLREALRLAGVGA
jgi:TolB-like protein